MKPWLLAAAIAVLAVPVGQAPGQDLPLPTLVVRGGPAVLPVDFPLHERHDRPPVERFVPAQIAAESAAGATLPTWSASIADGVSGKSFTYTMVGQNPQTPLASPALSVEVPIVPVVFTFNSSGRVFDPTQVDPVCSPAGSVVDLTLASPVFSTVHHLVTTKGGSDLGTGQYPGLFQRANFFQFAGPGGVNPGFALHLKPKVINAIQVPIAGTIKNEPCGQLGMIEMTAWDVYVKAVLFRKLRRQLTPDKLPLFLFYNVVMYNTTVSNCCTLGYHSAFSNPEHGNALQTYAVANFNTSGQFVASDVSTLSHEIAEWQDDPTVNNATPAWGHVGQDPVSCQKDLEVGDPLSGAEFPVSMPNGFTYHVQDLAFLSWFYHQTPSIGADGFYSLWGTFSKPAAPCPPLALRARP